MRCPWHGLECDVRTGRSLGDVRWRVKVYETNVTDDGVIEVLV